MTLEDILKQDDLFQEINYDSARGGVSVITEKGDITTSYLLIQRAKSSDSGQYTCSPSNANSKSVQVHILAGEIVPRFIYISRKSKTKTFQKTDIQFAYRLMTFYLRNIGKIYAIQYTMKSLFVYRWTPWSYAQRCKLSDVDERWLRVEPSDRANYFSRCLSHSCYIIVVEWF